MTTKDTGGQRQTTRRAEETEEASPEAAEEVRERQEKLSDDVEAILDEIDEVMVDRNLADLVDDDGGVGERRRGQSPAQQRGFAAAEKTGQHRRRQGLRFGHALTTKG